MLEYFFYCRDRQGTDPLLEEFAEAHWSFMDAYAEVMIARGPTLTADRTTHTGSMHIVDLPDADGAQVFAFKEPYRDGAHRLGHVAHDLESELSEKCPGS